MKIAAIPVLLALLVACDAKSDAAAPKAEPKAEKAEPAKDAAPEPEAEPAAAAAVEPKAEPKVEPEPEPEPNPYETVTLEDAKRVVEARGYKVGKTTTPLENVTMMAFEKKAKPLPIGGAIVFREKTTAAAELAKNETSMSTTVVAGPERAIEVRMLDAPEERKAILADLAKGT